MSKITVGSQVQYSAAWLKSIGAYMGELAFLVGEVIRIKKVGPVELAVIEWQDGSQAKVNVRNLKVKGSLEIER